MAGFKKVELSNNNHSSTSTEEIRKFPVKSLLIAAIFLAGAAAVLDFNISVSTVLLFGFLGFMLFGHLFMPAGQGGHDHSTSPPQRDDGYSYHNGNSNSISEHSHMDGPAGENDPESKPDEEQDSHQDQSYSSV